MYRVEREDKAANFNPAGEKRKVTLMKRKIKCPRCGREIAEKLCFCGWDFTADFVAYPSVSRIHEESAQFHTVTNIYIEKVQEMRKKAEAAYQASLNADLEDLEKTAADLKEAENLMKTILRRDASDENFEWFGKIYMQKTSIQKKLQRSSGIKINLNMSKQRQVPEYAEQLKFSKTLREAEKGNTEAQFAVGYMYEYGKGTEIDYDQAVKYYQMAAEKNHSGAQHNLAVLFYTGRGVEKDLKRAYQWFRNAAQNGLGLSMTMLGTMCENGEYIRKNLKTALYWYQEAYKAGDKAAYDKWQKAKIKAIRSS